MHMISKKDLSEAEMDTLTKSCSPTIVITANGEVQTQEEAIVYVKELGKFLTMKVLENTPAVLSLGKLCDENGYSYEWINGQKPHLIKNGIRIICNTENFVPIVVPGLCLQTSVMKRLRERTRGRGEGRSQKTTSHEERHAHWHWCRWANCQRVVRLWKERIWLLATWRHRELRDPVRRPARIRQPLPPQVTDHMPDRPFELHRFAQVLRSSPKRCCGRAFGHDCRPFETGVGESA